MPSVFIEDRNLYISLERRLMDLRNQYLHNELKSFLDVLGKGLDGALRYFTEYNSPSITINFPEPNIHNLSSVGTHTVNTFTLPKVEFYEIIFLEMIIAFPSVTEYKEDICERMFRAMRNSPDNDNTYAINDFQRLLTGISQVIRVQKPQL